MAIFTRAAACIAVVAVLATGSCSRSDSAPSESGTNSGGGGAPNPATTITVGASGVSPRTLTVPRGTQVTFVNADGQSHVMASDPHPTHTDCPELNAVGFLAAGTSRQTSNLNTAMTCGYHDHDRPQNTSLQGSITIQ